MRKKAWFSLAIFSLLTVGSLRIQAQVTNQGPLDHLRFVDIRDLRKNNTELASTSNLLMTTLERNSELFLGPGTSHISFHRSGAQGPNLGSVQSVEGKKVYIYSDENDGRETRTNTILGAELEHITVEDIDRGIDQAQVFTLYMILFVHNDQRVEGRSPDDYYFKRVALRVDWTIPKERASERVQILDSLPEIPLSRTQFQVVGDLLGRKVILEDRQNQITKVFPIGVGSFDVRTAFGMDNHVSLMTFEFQDAVLKKTDSQRGFYPNTRSRIYPSYYKGRPFLAIFDRTKGYRQIGMHYQIDDDGLRRGFVSHGCVRVEDKYLYQLDAILNEGLQDEIPIKIVYDLKGYENIDHPMPKLDSGYNIVNYSELTPPNGGKWTSVACKHSTYNVRYYGNTFHTIADGDCLTRVSYRSGSVYEIIDYLKGQSMMLPQAYISRDNHVPVSEQSDEGGEIEAGNRNSEDFESLEDFSRKFKKQNILKSIIPGRRNDTQEPTKQYLRTYCKNKNLSNSRNCREAMKERLKNSGGGLY